MTISDQSMRRCEPHGKPLSPAELGNVETRKTRSLLVPPGAI
jgi:hypothetical protein